MFLFLVASLFTLKWSLLWCDYSWFNGVHDFSMLDGDGLSDVQCFVNCDARIYYYYVCENTCYTHVNGILLISESDLPTLLYGFIGFVVY